jgi:membrane dipeptidase
MPTSRRAFIQLSAATTLAGLSVRGAPGAETAESLYASAIAIDGLGSPGSLETESGEPLSPAEVRDVASSGLTAVHVTVGEVGTLPRLAAFESAVGAISRWEKEIDLHPEVLARARSVAEIEAAKAAGRTGLIYGLQDGVCFEDDLDRLDILHRLGIRVVQPTYNRRNLLGDGCMEPANAGLSRDGRAAIERLDALGIMVDMSHCGRRTTADAFAVSTKPVSFTHTGCYALAEHPRHRTDDEIRRASDSGGVTGIFIMPYLANGRQPTAADVLRHVEHAIDVGGEDHVALGTDGNVSPSVLTPEYVAAFRESVRRRKELGIAAPFETEEGYLFAKDLNTSRRFETLADRMLAAGFSETRIEKVLGANLVRAFGDCWQT